MLDASTLYLLLAMTGFVCVAVVLVHRHNCDEAIQRKRKEVENLDHFLGKKIKDLEQNVLDIQIKLDEVEDQANSLREPSGS